MSEMRRSPREFWRLFKSGYSGSVGDIISNEDFKKYFSELMAGGETSDDEFSDFVNQFNADSVQHLIHWTPPYQKLRSCGPLRKWVQIRPLLLKMFCMSTSKSLFSDYKPTEYVFQPHIESEFLPPFVVIKRGVNQIRIFFRDYFNIFQSKSVKCRNTKQ